MSRGWILGLGLLVPAALSAQEGSIAYTHSVRVDLEIPEAMRARLEARRGSAALPRERVSEVILLFNSRESLMKPVPPAEQEGGAGQREPAMRAQRLGMPGRMGSNSTSRRDRETVVEAHLDFEEGTIVESRDFLGRRFLIEDDLPEFRWKLTGEQAEFLGYVVQKATAQQDSSVVEAWFTPEIPIPGGPAMYGGLPGMILVVSVDEGKVQYTATAVSLTTVAEGVIVTPKDGERVTRERYEQIVAEKLKELSIVGDTQP